jgi:hypothetical protein
MAPGPTVQAEIFSREYIQNSWDSIQKKTEPLDRDIARQAAIHFRFVELKGPQGASFIEAFGLADHARRLEGMSGAERINNRLPEESFLHGEESDSVRVLIASESFGEGMHGSWDHGDDVAFEPPRMKIATIQTRTGKIDEGTGGSWGEGKKAVVSASLCRTIAVYSCHGTIKGVDPHVHSRFMGVTYWKAHARDGKRRAGLGLLGRAPGQGEDFAAFRPLENEEALEMVRALDTPGLDPRDPDKLSDHGTTYVFVDPSFSANDLVWAIERNWWPLIKTQRLNFSVTDYDGTELVIHPEERDQLKPIINAYDVALGNEQPGDSAIAEEIRVGDLLVGQLGLIADVSDFGWSFERRTEEDEQNRDLIALIRNDMVISYHSPFPRGQSAGAPFIRGAFVVDHDDELNSTLKMSEGKLHNSWDSDELTVPSKAARRLVKGINEAMRGHVKEFKKKIDSKIETTSFRIKAFEDVFAGKGRTTNASAPSPPTAPHGRNFSIQGVSDVEREYSSDDPTQLRFTATAQISLQDHVESETMDVDIQLGWKVAANTAPANEPELSDDGSIEIPSSFKRVNGGATLQGTLTKTPMTFRWTSRYFPDDWQVIPAPGVSTAKAAVE